MNVSLSPFTPDILQIIWSHEPSLAVPSRVISLLILHTRAQLKLVRSHGMGFLPLSATAFIYLYRQPPSGQPRVHQVTHLRTDGVYCRESAGTEPVLLVLKVVPVMGAAFSGIPMDQFLCVSLFPGPLLRPGTGTIYSIGIIQWTCATLKVKYISEAV